VKHIPFGNLLNTLLDNIGEALLTALQNISVIGSQQDRHEVGEELGNIASRQRSLSTLDKRLEHVNGRRDHTLVRVLVVDHVDKNRHRSGVQGSVHKLVGSKSVKKIHNVQRNQVVGRVLDPGVQNQRSQNRLQFCSSLLVNLWEIMGDNVEAC
jgi:hypothetical protein